MNLKIDGHSPIPIRRQLTELQEHVIEGASDSRNQVLPSLRELLIGFLGIAPTRACAPSGISSGVGTGRFSP